MSKMVKQAVDLASLPPLTARQRKELEALAAKPDNGIDVSDIPALGDAFWRNAVRNPFYKPTKTPTTVRVDSDVLLWLKSKGRGYQTKINAILREAMLREVAPEASSRASGRPSPRSKH